MNRFHYTNFTKRTFANINTHDSVNTLQGAFGFGLEFYFIFHLQCSCTTAVYAVIANFNKSFGQNVHAETPQKLNTRKVCRLYFSIIAIIFNMKTHTIVIDIDNAMIRNCYSIDVLP